MKKKIKGSILAMVGYILSPLSWWNDLFLNIPLAYAFAFPFGLISKKLFFPMMILGYWLTNVLGFMMMHHGFNDLVSKDKKEYTKKEIKKDILISVLYTLFVALLVKLNILKFPLDYFK